MLKVIKYPLAEEDLIDIWVYGFETWSASTADHYLDSLNTKIQSLAEQPKRYKLRQEFEPPVRICPHVSHIIIYTIEKDAIAIIRVLHKSMELEQHLLE